MFENYPPEIEEQFNLMQNKINELEIALQKERDRNSNLNKVCVSEGKLGRIC